MQEIQFWSLGWEDPLEKKMATHSSIFAWKIPWTEEPGGLQFLGLQKVKHDWARTRAFMQTQEKNMERVLYEHILNQDCKKMSQMHTMYI